MEERDEMIREHMEIRQARKSAEKQIDKKDENRKSDIEIGLEILSNSRTFNAPTTPISNSTLNSHGTTWQCTTKIFKMAC